MSYICGMSQLKTFTKIKSEDFFSDIRRLVADSFSKNEKYDIIKSCLSNDIEKDNIIFETFDGEESSLLIHYNNNYDSGLEVNKHVDNTFHITLSEGTDTYYILHSFDEFYEFLNKTLKNK